MENNDINFNQLATLLRLLEQATNKAYVLAWVDVTVSDTKVK